MSQELQYRILKSRLNQFSVLAFNNSQHVHFFGFSYKIKNNVKYQQARKLYDIIFINAYVIERYLDIKCF